MSEDFFTSMLAGDAQSNFEAEMNVGVAQGDSLLSRMGIPTGALTDESVANFQGLTETTTAQLALKRQLTALVKTYTGTLVKIAEEENKCRELGIATTQKLNELKAEAAKAWAKYQSATMVLTAQTKNAIGLIGYQAGKEVTHQNFLHTLNLEKEDKRYDNRREIAQARHDSWVSRIQETISTAIGKLKNQGTNQQLPQGQSQKVFGIFDNKKVERR